MRSFTPNDGEFISIIKVPSVKKMKKTVVTPLSLIFYFKMMKSKKFHSNTVNVNFSRLKNINIKKEEPL